MTSNPSGDTAASGPNVASLVDAIDARARQAGSEGATAVMQRMLGSVTEVLAGIQDRLDNLEEVLAAGGAAGSGSTEGLAEVVQSGLAAFNVRLGRLEEAFVQAVDESGSGTQAVVSEVRTAVVQALAESATSGEGSIDAQTRESLARVEVVMGARLDGLEELLRGRATEGVDATVAARVDEALGRVEAALGALPGRLASLEEQVAAFASTPSDDGAAPVDATVLHRLEEAVERIERDESSGRLVKLVEERMSVGLRAVTERTDEVRRAVDQLAKESSAPSRSDDGALDDLVASVRAMQSAAHDVPDQVAAAVGEQLVPLVDRLSGLVDQINGAVRREAELLTQRVAALAVGVEASRVLLERHLQETENSIGRKAGEVTRRLAADFGITSRRSGPGGRRDPRELGSG